MDHLALTYDERDRDAAHFPRGRELAAIIAFWTVFAALTIANWVFPASGQGPLITVRAVSIGVVESLLWLLVTPPIFWLTSRYIAERGDRRQAIVLYLLVGALIALAADLAVSILGTQVLPPPPRSNGMPRDRPFWAFVRVRFLNDYIVVLAIFAAGVARDYIARYHRRLEEASHLRAQLAEARLHMLQSQLNPHFLFNTLNAVSALVDRDPRGVRRMIARLSELLRATLEPSHDPEVTVAREVALLARYLEILQIRFQGRLETRVDAPAALHEALVPPLILQPLVENAMKHAVAHATEGSRVNVRIERQGESLVLSVEDTGCGAADAARPPEPGTGIGLRNVRARLEQIYAEAHSLTLEPNDVGGMTATIRLPYHTSADLRAVPANGELP